MPLESGDELIACGELIVRTFAEYRHVVIEQAPTWKSPLNGGPKISRRVCAVAARTAQGATRDRRRGPNGRQAAAAMTTTANPPSATIRVATGVLSVEPFRFRDRAHDQLLEHGLVEVGEPLEI